MTNTWDEILSQEVTLTGSPSAIPVCPSAVPPSNPPTRPRDAVDDDATAATSAVCRKFIEDSHSGSFRQFPEEEREDDNVGYKNVLNVQRARQHSLE